MPAEVDRQPVTILRRILRLLRQVKTRMGTTVSHTSSSPEPDDAAGGGNQSDRLLLILGQSPLRMVQMLRLSRIINDCTQVNTRMGTTVSHTSLSPEPDDAAGGGNQSDRLLLILGQSPLRMVQMLRLSRIINDCTQEEKLALFQDGVLKKIMLMIADCGSVVPPKQPPPPRPVAGAADAAGGSLHQSQLTLNGGSPASTQKQQRRRRNSSLPQVKAGVGYGRGSTKSRWDLERALEERLIREEHLIWLLHALTAYLYCASPDFGDPEQVLDKAIERPLVHINEGVVTTLEFSAIVPLLEYHLNNESVFDVSEHMELYQALLEVACSMALHPSLLNLLTRQGTHREDAKSVVRDLMPKFRATMTGYPNSFKGLMGSPDFRLVDFIQKVERWCELLDHATERYSTKLLEAAELDAERFLSSDIGKADTPEDGEGDASCSGGSANGGASQQSTPLLSSPKNVVPSAGRASASCSRSEADLLYSKSLKHLQISTFRFIGDYGKVVVPYSFKKEARNLNPFSPALKERTKRIAKELASLPNSLPLNASNSIFVCVDEGRCDIMKVLISGPDETPYQNGLFEFDVFFPQSYPFSPPKISFLTTGNGHVRFNPNLYNDGKICLSILGTWEGRPEEKWNPYCSLLQVLISIQGLIFVKDPYFNEPGFEKYMGTDKGSDHSKKYNLQIEHATLQFAVKDQLHRPPEHFRKVTQRHFWLKRQSVIDQGRTWLASMKREWMTAGIVPALDGGAAGSDPAAATAKSPTTAAAAASNKKKSNNNQENNAVDPLVSSMHTQEKNIQMLVEDLNAMACPYEDIP